MDAHVFPAGAHLEPAIVAAHGTEDAADRAFAAGKDFQRYAGTGESRDEQHETFYRARRAAGSGGSGSVVGSRGDVFVVHGSDGERNSAEPRSGADDCVYFDASGSTGAEHADFLGDVAGDAGRGLSGRGAAPDAATGTADGKAAGIQ